MLVHLVRQTKDLSPVYVSWESLQDGQCLVCTPGDFSYLSLPSSSSSSISEDEVILIMTFSKKPIGKNSSRVTGTSGSCSSRSIGRISCLLMFLDLFYLLNDDDSSFILVSFYDRKVSIALGFASSASSE